MSNWNTDAQLAGELKSEQLHKNAAIKDFLEKRNFDKFIIVASKGMGKTLLMRHKREQIQNSPDGFLIIPTGEQSDYVNIPSVPSNSILKSLEDVNFWEDLWKASIIISMILNHSLYEYEEEKEILIKSIKKNKFPIDIEDLMVSNVRLGRAQFVRPSKILDIFLREGKQRFELFRKFGLNSLDELYHKIVRSACAVFIDSLDQELNKRFPGNLNIWCAGQIGLLKASWELQRNNKHSKIFVTIRQEAFSNYVDSEKLNVDGNILLIKYNEKDLKTIFEKSIKAYDGNYTIEEFFGFAKIYNGFIKIQEDPFKYLLRHTIGVPRWFMILGKAISESRDDRGLIENPRARRSHQRQIAELINSMAGEKLAADYLQGELKLFFGGRDPKAVVSELLKFVQSTVLSYANLQRLSARYAENSSDPISHPFCLLMNIGLLGHTAPNARSTGSIQKFRRPYEFDWEYKNILPDSPDVYFLLHPCIHYLAQSSNNYFRFAKIKIGNEIIWTKKDERILKENKASIFISYSTKDWDRYVKNVVEDLECYFNEKGIITDIWIDRRKMRSGALFIDQMAKGISDSRFFIMMVSEESLKSKVVQVEWKEKFTKGFSEENNNIFPFIVDETGFEKLPSFLKGIHCYRYENKNESVRRLAEDIVFWMDERYIMK